MEVTKFTTVEKTPSSSHQRQVHVDRFFLTSKVLSTRNSYPLVKPSMASFTVRFWSSWRRAFDANVQTSGRKTIGFSTMAACPLTHHSMFDKFLTSKNIRVLPHPPYSPDHTLFHIPQHEITAEGVLFWHDWGDPRRIARGYTHSRLRTSRDAWNHGKHTAITVYMPKGTILKETVETRSFGKKLYFMIKFPIFLGSPTHTHITNSGSFCRCVGDV